MSSPKQRWRLACARDRLGLSLTIAMILMGGWYVLCLSAF